MHGFRGKIQGAVFTCVPTTNKHKVRNIFLLVLFDFLICQAGSTTPACLDDCQPNYMSYTSLSCDDVESMGIVLGYVLDRVSLPSEARCAFYCYQKVECRHAVYIQRWFRSCQMISDLEVTRFPVGYGEESCTVLRFHQPLRCKNCGKALQTICSCNLDFMGRHCEKEKPSRCNKTDMIDISDDYEALQDLERTHETVKIVVSHLQTLLSTKSIYTLSLFQWINNTHSGIANGFLSVDLTSQTFALPASVEFKYFVNDSYIWTYAMGVDGSLSTTYSDGHSMSLLTRSDFNSSPVLYNSDDSTGYPRVVTNGLDNGHRLLTRSPSRVGYDAKEAYFESLTSVMGAYEDRLILPLFFTTFRQTMLSEKLFRAFYFVAHEEGIFLNSTNATKQWQLDNCWYGPSMSISLNTTIQILSIAVLQGQEIRLIMGDAISSDIVEISLTRMDIVVALVPHLSPFGVDEDFTENSTLIYQVVSGLKMISECETAFQGGKFLSLKTGEYLGSLRWVYGARLWTLILEIDASSVIQYGNKENVTAFAELGHDLRVCVLYSHDVITCYATAVVHLVTDFNVLLQTLPAVDVIFNQKGEFTGIADSECQLHEYLISTEGWIKSIRYTMGQSDTHVNESIPFDRLNWFVAI